MGKTTDLVKKIRDSKGTFHAKIGTINNRNCKDLTEAKEIKKRWQECTDKPYKKALKDPECEVAPLGPPAPAQPLLLGRGVAPLHRSCSVAAWCSWSPPLTLGMG